MEILFRIKTADEQYKQGFFDELTAFRERVQTRAKQKIADAVKQYEEVDLLKNEWRKYFIKIIFSRKNDRNV